MHVERGHNRRQEGSTVRSLVRPSFIPFFHFVSRLVAGLVGRIDGLRESRLMVVVMGVCGVIPRWGVFRWWGWVEVSGSWEDGWGRMGGVGWVG